MLAKFGKLLTEPFSLGCGRAVAAMRTVNVRLISPNSRLDTRIRWILILQKFSGLIIIAHWRLRFRSGPKSN
jgi:hypothetical protein